MSNSIAPPSYPDTMRKEVARLIKLGDTPTNIVKQIDLIKTTNLLTWPALDPKLVSKWNSNGQLPVTIDPPGSPLNRHMVFVYGTLKKGMGNDRLTLSRGGSFVAKATTGPEFVMYDGGFPYVASVQKVVRANPAHVEKAGQIDGEVWLVNDDCLKQLDMLEGVPHHYTRDPVTVIFRNAERTVARAQIYLLAQTDRIKHTPPMEPKHGRLSWVPRYYREDLARKTA